jgi:hypothetical protein
MTSLITGAAAAMPMLTTRPAAAVAPITANEGPATS